MRLSTVWAMMGGTGAPLFLRSMRMLEPVHRVAWLASAVKHGVLDLLRHHPRSHASIADALGAAPAGHEVVRSWLQHGVLLGELRFHAGMYELRGTFSRKLADPRNSLTKAFIEALVSIHHDAVYGALDNLTELRSLDDLPHELVARVSELLAPVLREVVDRHVPSRGPARLLELGCGNGRHLRHACERNPRLTGVGVDLDPAVAARASELLELHSLDGRARVEAGDLRTFEIEERFDVVTMFNLIYYFAPEERDAVIRRAAGWLDDGGKLIITTSCRGGTLGTNMLDLWFSSMRECGPLPESDAVPGWLAAAGLDVEAPTRLAPGQEYYLFVGRKAGHSRRKAVR